MKWLMLVSSLDASDGGPPRAVLGLSRAIAAAGDQVVVVTHRHADGEPDDEVANAVAEGVDIEWVARRTATRFQLSPRLLRAAIGQARSADVIVAHGFYQFTCVAAGISSVVSRDPLFLQPHGVFEPYQETFSSRVKSLFMATAGRGVLRRTSAIVTASASEGDGLRITLGSKSPPVLQAGLGVDTELRPSQSREITSQRNVLFLSRIAPKKRLDKLVRAANLLAAAGRPIRLTVCGDGDPALVAELRRLADPGLEVHWVGHVSGADRDSVESTQTLFCLPSDNENFGQAVTEAMARGLPVVTTRATGSSEHVKRAECGWVLDDPDPQQLATCLDEALSDPDRLASMSSNAAAYVRRELSWDEVAQRWMGRARELTAAGGGGPSSPRAPAQRASN